MITADEAFKKVPTNNNNMFSPNLTAAKYCPTFHGHYLDPIAFQKNKGLLRLPDDS